MIAIIIFGALAAVGFSTAVSLREQLRETMIDLDAVMEIVGGSDSTQDPQTSQTLLERTAELEASSLLALEASEALLDLTRGTKAQLDKLEFQLCGDSDTWGGSFREVQGCDGPRPLGHEIPTKGLLGKLNDCINELALMVFNGNVMVWNGFEFRCSGYYPDAPRQPR